MPHHIPHTTYRTYHIPTYPHTHIPHIPHTHKQNTHSQKWLYDCYKEPRKLDEKLYLYRAAKQGPAKDNEKPATEEAESSGTEEDETSIKLLKQSIKDTQHKKATPTIEKGKEKGKGDKDALPDIFVGCKIFIHGEPDNDKELRRYLVAYGAQIDSIFEEESTTHVISNTTEVTPPTSLHSSISFFFPFSHLPYDIFVGMGTVQDLEEFRSAKGVLVVPPMWGWDSINTNARRNERHYKINSPVKY